MTTKIAEFNHELWHSLIPQRAKIIRPLIRKKLLLGKTKKEILDLFGLEENYYDLDEWAYPVDKNFLGGTTFLLLNYKGETVESTKLHRVFEFGNNCWITI